MIVGGLLASGLALGVGTASADQILGTGDQCTIPAVGDVLKATGVVKDGKCVDAATGLINLGSVANSVEENAAQAEVAQKAADQKAADQKAADQKAADQKAAKDKTAADKAAADKAAADRAAADAAATQAAQQQAQLAGGPVGGPAPAPFVAPPAVAAAGPLGVFSPAALGGIAPAGLASNLFGANAYDPGLLFGSPLGGAAAQLFNPKAGSGVTTVSQAQVLAAPSRGYGTPATIGVIILACLIGFAVRHRVISRMKARDLPEETAPRHAAPEVEQIDEDSDARTTVLTR